MKIKKQNSMLLLWRWKSRRRKVGLSNEVNCLRVAQQCINL